MNGTPRHSQRGQTLIETVTAVFILVMGISTALGLGIYAFKSADDSTKVIVATSLAREAIEGVKNQRDSNWISDSLNVRQGNEQCTFNGGTTQQPCSNYWLNNLNSGTYAFDFDTGQQGSVGTVLTPNPSSYALLYCPATQTYISNTPGAPICQGEQPTIYSRKVVLNVASSYNGTNYFYSVAGLGGQLPAFLSAVVTVWWTSRTCPQTNDPTTLPSSCQTTLELHLTNWQKTFN